jgi:hypothetical protein
MKLYFFFVVGLVLISCSVKPKSVLIDQKRTSLDYSNSDYWAASPFKEDPSDRRPDDFFIDSAQIDKIDVFFLHPTTYIGTRGQNQWNSSIDDQELNDKTDNSSMLYQASLFNCVGRVFAPRYRQAHLHAYYTKDKASAKKAFEIAYKDARNSFEYYLKHYNQGRGIIIASHSQGTTHAARLIKEFFDEKPLENQFVAAYLVGLPVPEDAFKSIKPCRNPNDISCVCSWRTWQKGHQPKKQHEKEILVTNPLTWKTDETYAPKSMNLGGLVTNFKDGLLPELADAQVHDEVLWTTKPKFKGSFFITFKNYHRGDLNLYYANIRENAKLRSRTYLQHQVRM